jgi:benzoyl-CoA reductase/2-hydroxyglutaryl-CoA dehydratase subunit BcrC/BadD/HgdB
MGHYTGAEKLYETQRMLRAWGRRKLPNRGVDRIYENLMRNIGITKQLAKQEPVDQVMIGYYNCVAKADREILYACDKGLPLVESWGIANEVIQAMGITTMSSSDIVAAHLPFDDGVSYQHMDDMPLPDDFCTLVRAACYGVSEHIAPTPKAIIGMPIPCDGLAMYNQVIATDSEWSKVPQYQVDGIYGTSPEEYQRFADEYRRIEEWLEGLFPGYKVDYDRLREIVREKNKQYEIWHEYNRLMRAKPAPGFSFKIGCVGWQGTQHLIQGDPEMTAVLQLLLDQTEQTYRAGVSPIGQEKIRICWPDLKPTWFPQLAEWLAKEYGAVVVMDNEGIDPYEPLDDTTPEAMYYSLAKNYVDTTPMVRQSRGEVQFFIDDLVYGVQEMGADCVIWPGHRGHKDQAASSKLVSDMCRQLGVPMLHLNTDLFDHRYTPFENVVRQIAEFFEATGLAQK